VTGNDERLVLVVHHVDAEGPLYEPMGAVFERIEEVFDLRIASPANKATLRSIQAGTLEEIPIRLRSEVAAAFSKHLLDFKSDWAQIEELLSRVRSPTFRRHVPDSFDRGWVFNWHVMDHAGFETNERSRDLGYLNVFNRYSEMLRDDGEPSGDELHWHFHPISFGREAHISATSYDNSSHELHQIISRRLIEKAWFPRVNRAGFHTVRPDSNLFLEQWIPFDASNQSIDQTAVHQSDARDGRFGDWRGAPDDWSVYHPALRDWRRPGELNRVIARCLNLKTRYRNVSEAEVEKAFAKADRGEAVYLGITNHDFREMSVEIAEFSSILSRVGERWPRVSFAYSGAIHAFRRVLGYSPLEVSEQGLQFTVAIQENVLRLRVTRGALFGPQPYLALKTRDGRFLHDNFDFGEADGEFSYTFDRQTVLLENLERIGVASNDRFGNCWIAQVDVATGAPATRYHGH
jgi:hypothetical protein